MRLADERRGGGGRARVFGVPGPLLLWWSSSPSAPDGGERHQVGDGASVTLARAKLRVYSRGYSSSASLSSSCGSASADGECALTCSGIVSLRTRDVGSSAESVTIRPEGIVERLARLAAFAATAAFAFRSAAVNDKLTARFFSARAATSFFSSSICCTISIIDSSDPAQHLYSWPRYDKRRTSGFSMAVGVLGCERLPQHSQRSHALLHHLQGCRSSTGFLRQ